MRSLALLALASILGACVAPADGPAPSEPTTSSGPPSASPVPRDEAAASPTLAVAHDRELRGAWISTVWNGTWPSASGLSPAEAKAELVAMLDALASARMNAVFLQVRAEGDAIYRSSLEPWSRFLTGTMGEDPGWDPLAFAVDEAHARGIELHAWMNPYRGLTSRSVVAPSSHVSKTLSAHAVPWGTQLWMDPGAPAVRAHVKRVVADVLARYDVDGLHFDDYFYPYPIADTSFPDDAQYDAYVAAGGAEDKLGWRRSNVNALVREVGELVAAARPDVRFGISPFGVYRPGVPEGVTGLDAYDVLACDPVAWMEQGWVDYLVPQLYWSTTKEGRPFGKLASFWAGLAKDGRSIFAGHDLTQMGPEGWPLSEVDAQMSLARAERGRGLRGNVFFTAKALASDELGVRTAFAATYWAKPAATPPLASAVVGGSAVPAPALSTAGREVTISPPPVATRAYAVYAVADDGGVTLAELRPARASGATTLALGAGRWAVSVVDRRGVESPGTPVELR